jgi:hypothetical protein
MTHRQRTSAQSLVEFAFALPIVALVIMVTIQLSIIFVAYYSETRMARETARWLAINSSASDDAVATHVQSTMLPGLANGSPSANLGNLTDAQYEIGNKMTVQFTSCGTSPSAPPCTNPNRASGSTLYVQMSYDIHTLLFLPTDFHMGALDARIPTALPAYRVHVLVE